MQYCLNTICPSKYHSSQPAVIKVRCQRCCHDYQHWSPIIGYLKPIFTLDQVCCHFHEFNKGSFPDTILYLYVFWFMCGIYTLHPIKNFTHFYWCVVGLLLFYIRHQKANNGGKMQEMLIWLWKFDSKSNYVALPPI